MKGYVYIGSNINVGLPTNTDQPAEIYDVEGNKALADVGTAKGIGVRYSESTDLWVVDVFAPSSWAFVVR